MSDEVQTRDELPEAILDDRRRVSLVWLIPLVAILAAVWLGYRSYQQQGPLVTISFRTAEGLEAGKTKVRFKDVDVGLVESIGFAPDLAGVKVRARLSHQVEDYLNEKTRFWVARPRLSGGQVSGLETIVGGTYIAVDLIRGENDQREFEGLEVPPIVTATDPGKQFVLHAAGLGSLSVGSPVLYRGIEVGRVVSYTLQEPHGVDIQVFVHAPHDAKVGTNTRFWNVSGVNMTLDASGVRLQADSLASLLLGGIAFGLPAGSAAGDAAVDGAAFPLAPDRESALARRYQRRQVWQLAFSGSVRGLLPGAPVELRGIRIGEVLDVQLRLEGDQREVTIPVTVSIEPERLGIEAAAAADDERSASERALWEKLVGHGLRAQLKTGNLVTGALYVDLDFYPDDEVQQVVWAPVPQLPTVPTPLDELRGLLARLARLPLGEIGQELSASMQAMRDTMASTNALLQRLDRETTTELTKTLQQTRQTLDGLEKILKPSSPLQAEAHHALQELSAAARSFRIMADYLERHPEALIRGKGAAPQ